MPRPRDAKIWNEDLVTALDARYQLAQRNGKRTVHSWRNARDAIQQVRQDIYVFQSGRIVNLPSNLGSKTIQAEVEDIIRGIKRIYPDGFVPPSGASAAASAAAASPIRRGVTRASSPSSASYAAANPVISHNNRAIAAGVGTAGAASSRRETSTSQAYHSSSDHPDHPSNHHNNHHHIDNPFYNASYTKSIKIRGGAFAILMAFHHSPSDVLLKRQILQQAQPFCDDQMEANYMAGRTYGAWKAIDTLKQKHFVSEQGHRYFSPTAGGFRDRPHQYTLTRDGKLFLQALLATRPEAAQAAGVVHDGGGTGAGNNFRGATAGSASTSASLDHNSIQDIERLDTFVTTAQVGDSIDFKVGKKRRMHLHRHCDQLQLDNGGLLLQNNSMGDGRNRTLTIRLLQKPKDSNNNKRKATSTAAMTSPGSSTILSTKRPRDTLTPAQHAAAAAEQRRREYYAQEEYDSELKRAKEESKKMSRSRKKNQKEDTVKLAPVVKSSTETIELDLDDHNDDDDDDDEMKQAKAESRRLAEQQQDKKMPAAARNLNFDNEEDMFNAAIQESLKDQQKKSALDSAIDLQSSSDSEDGDDDDCKKPAAKAQDSIDLLSDQEESPGDQQEAGENNKEGNSNNQEEVIEIEDSQESSIDIPEILQGVNPENDDGDDEDEVICLDDDDEEDSKNSDGESSNKRKEPPESTDKDCTLTVLIDSRERNRNTSPRVLRKELERHFESGSLKKVLPTSMNTPQVQERRLDHGDFIFTRTNEDSGQEAVLEGCIERKRVNDLVHRSADGDHLKQLQTIQQFHSLPVLLLEYDLRSANMVTPYNAQEYYEQGFDPYHTTIENEDQIYNLFGRLLAHEGLNCKFIQTKDEQASLRSVGAMGIMSFAKDQEQNKKVKKNTPDPKEHQVSDGVQLLSDILIHGGIPYRIAKRVASAVGGHQALVSLYQSCCNETARKLLLEDVVSSYPGYEDLYETGQPFEWSEAIYRTILSSDEHRTKGQQAILLSEKHGISNHAVFLCRIYQGDSADQALQYCRDNFRHRPLNAHKNKRKVTIHLSKPQSKFYFDPPPPPNTTPFYEIEHLSKNFARSTKPIVMKTVSPCGTLCSKSVVIFELRARTFIEWILMNWTKKQENLVPYAQKFAAALDEKFKYHCSMSAKRVIMLIGLDPALDKAAKKPGHKPELKTVVDMILADLMLRTDITIIQARDLKPETKVKIVRQLTLAMKDFSFCTQIHSSEPEDTSSVES